MRGYPKEKATLFATNKVVKGADGREFKVIKVNGIKTWVALSSQQEYKKKIQALIASKDLNFIKEKITGIQHLQITPMGSCQYAGVLAMYRLLEILSFYYDDPFVVLHITATTGKLNDAYLDLLGNHVGKKIKSLEEYFRLSKKNNKDLWTTCKLAFEAIFPTAQINVQQAASTGPVLNQLMQSDNNYIGIIMYILIKTKLVKKLETFFDFST